MDELFDDARQILTILNSLDIVGVQTLELKLFIKELKLLRKLEDRKCQKWKEMNAKIIKKQDFIKDEINNSLVNTLNDILIWNQKRESTEIRTGNSEKITLTQIDKQTNIKINKKCSKFNSSPVKHSDNLIKKKNEEPFCKCLRMSSNKKLKVEISSFQNINNLNTYNTKEKVCDKSCYIFNNKSFTKNKFISMQSNTLNMKKFHDPVTLYNKYKTVWKKLSLPGEDTRTRLRFLTHKTVFSSNSILKI